MLASPASAIRQSALNCKKQVRVIHVTKRAAGAPKSRAHFANEGFVLDQMSLMLVQMVLQQMTCFSVVKQLLQVDTVQN